VTEIVKHRLTLAAQLFPRGHFSAQTPTPGMKLHEYQKKGLTKKVFRN
jgi:hypothetical protein